MGVVHDVVVVGGGVAGLVAARDLAHAGQDVLLLDGAGRLGGKLCTGSIAGLPVDVGAEAMLARRPEGLDLATELGVEVVHPTDATSRIWSYGALRPMPRSLMGVPFDVDALATSGVLSGAGVARVRAEVVTAVDGDVSVGDLLAARLGDELVDRLAEPLLGGVYAGSSREISTAAAVPQLLAMAERGSLLEQAAALPRSDAPVFASLPGGMGRLPRLLVDQARFELDDCHLVRDLRSTASGWRLTGGIEATSIVLATPAAASARLLEDVAPEASQELAGIETASVAVVTLAFRAVDLPDHLVDVSGFLVPPIERDSTVARSIKAATFSFAKWSWVRDLDADVVVLRTSLGRHRRAFELQATDEGLVRVSLADLATMAGITATPVDSHVQRWGGGLPQYAVGHVEKVARIRTALPAGVTVCGASYDGVGIPAVIASARRAVASLTQAQ